MSATILSTCPHCGRREQIPDSMARYADRVCSDCEARAVDPISGRRVGSFNSSPIGIGFEARFLDDDGRPTEVCASVTANGIVHIDGARYRMVEGRFGGTFTLPLTAEQRREWFAQNPALEGERVRLEPLAMEHADDLVDAVAADDLWKRAWYTRIPAPDAMREEIGSRLARQRAGEMAPWAIVEPGTGRAIGMTSICGIAAEDLRVEVGYTWMRRGAQGTGINPAMKLLVLGRAFEALRCVRVEIRTHWHNQQSRAAIERLGAKLDGVLRSHTRMPDGTWRDTMVYSILATEWPQVRRGLESRLEPRNP